jgi:GTP-binding protein EngB required for normal cell division
VGFLGKSGAGKSSLINVLLDHEDLLPADDEKACTASVVEIAWNPK